MRSEALEVREVVKQFASVRAVDGISFEVQRGEIFALLGPNGAGKTTLVRMLLGIIQPDSGSVRWSLDGAEPGVGDPRRLGYLPEERGLHKDVPILRSLVYFGMLRGMKRRDARAAAESWLAQLELQDRAGDKLDSLSKGNQQKIQFAAAVLHRPSVAVLDEPFSGLDPVNQDRFLEHIQEMRDQGTTVILSAHQMPLVERIADRILLITRGRSLLTGTLEELRERARVGRSLILGLDAELDDAALQDCQGITSIERMDDGRLRLGIESDGPLNDILAELAQRASITSIHDERPNLHDIYVDAVSRSGGALPGKEEPA